MSVAIPTPNAIMHLVCKFPILVVPLIIGAMILYPQGTPECSPAAISFVFWDGDESAYTLGMPILDKYGYKGTVLLTTAKIDGQEYLTSQQIRTLADNDWEIGTHGVDYVDLTTIPETELLSQLKAQENLKKLGIDANIFATPQGKINTEVINHIKQHYAANILLTSIGLNPIPVNPEQLYKLKVVDINHTTTVEEAKHWIDSAIAKHQWIILVFHQLQLDHKESTLSWTSKNFQEIVEYAKQKQATQVFTIQDIELLK